LATVFLDDPSGDRAYYFPRLFSRLTRPLIGEEEMAKITFIVPSGDTVVVEAFSGSLMEVAVANAVEGIDAECGGVCSCATCHIHILPEWSAAAGEASAIESAMLELEDEAKEMSRLSCQVLVTEALDGCVARVVGR
jgi:2Fe-2S ferredoxin